MPVVFVHGVGTRTSPRFWSDLEVRSRLVRDFLFEPLGLPASSSVEFAYWGDHAAEFRWGHACLPGGGDEALGASEGTLAEMLAAYSEVEFQTDDSFLVAVARDRSVVEALDIMVAAAAEGASPADAEAIANAVGAALATLDTSSPPEWLATVRTDVELLTALADLSAIRRGDVEALGSTSRGWQRLREKLSRIRTAVPSGAAHATGKVWRPMFHDQAATFIGDVLVYLARPGTEDRRAAILAAVGETIETASQQRTDEDPLVVIAHSMGGNIVYDLLSSERTDLNVDTFVTVGSQVGLFQELNLFAAQHPELHPPGDRVPKPANIGRWINVYDRSDILGFAVSRIFEDAIDYEFGTGRGMLRAHSSYFIRPSFYERLAARLVG